MKDESNFVRAMTYALIFDGCMRSLPSLPPFKGMPGAQRAKAVQAEALARAAYCANLASRHYDATFATPSDASAPVVVDMKKAEGTPTAGPPPDQPFVGDPETEAQVISKFIAEVHGNGG